MIVKLFYDDCRHYSDDEEGYKVFLKKDRIIEFWIGDDE